MNGAFLLIPLMLARYALLGILSREALKRAAYFPPVEGAEKGMLVVYMITNLFMLGYLFFVKVIIQSAVFYGGLAVFIAGFILYTLSVVGYARHDGNGMIQKGLYRLSRNPMYVAYFIYFLGCALLTQSVLLLAVLVVFQVSVHWIIRSEERWCIKAFGDAYLSYMKRTRRYL